MPPVNPNDKPIDIVARPVNPDGTVDEPESASSSRPGATEVAFPGRHDDHDRGTRREEVRYWRFEGTGDDGCGCGGCGCLTIIVLLLATLLLQKCAGLLI